MTALALVVTGCGGGDDQATPTTVKTVTAERWAETVNALCVQADDDVQDVTAGGDEDFPAYAREMAAFLRAFAKDAKAAGVPKGLAVEAKDFVALYNESADLFADAAKNDTDPAVVVDKLNDKIDAINELALTLDVDDCVSDTTTNENSTGTTTPGDSWGTEATTTAPATAETWAAAANAVCAPLNTTYVDNGVFKGFADDPTSYAAQFQEFVNLTVDGLAAVPTPAGDVNVTALLNDYATLKNQAAVLADAAAAGDTRTATKAREDMSATLEHINTTAIAAGAQHCGGF
jgi:hypothetical protein